MTTKAYPTGAPAIQPRVQEAMKGLSTEQANQFIAMHELGLDRGDLFRFCQEKELIKQTDRRKANVEFLTATIVKAGYGAGHVEGEQGPVNETPGDANKGVPAFQKRELLRLAKESEISASNADTCEKIAAKLVSQIKDYYKLSSKLKKKKDSKVDSNDVRAITASINSSRIPSENSNTSAENFTLAATGSQLTDDDSFDVGQSLSL
ncbi:hypothetical protein NCC49_002546 [Naganishia albida]|nr:hypothetical protein NCC49_002546 [Naganishia albida]